MALAWSINTLMPVILARLPNVPSVVFCLFPDKPKGGNPMSAQVSRIKLLSLFCVLALLVPIVAGCTTQPAAAPTQAPAAQPAATQAPAPTPAPTTAPKPKVLKMARIYEPFSVFIPWQIDDNPALFLSVNVYDSLLRMTPDGQGIEPGLATEWKSAADGLSWTFTLRDGVKFSDGSPLKAEDVKTSIDLAAKSEKSAWASNYKAIKSVDVVDPKTIKINLTEPFAPLPSVMAMFCAAILPSDLAQASEAKDFDAASAWKTRGTGAYYIEGWKKGETIVLKRNPYYWKGKPEVDEIDIENIPDDNTRILKLQGGEVDLIDFVPLSQLASLATQPNIKAQAFTIAQITFIILNNEKKPLDDKKVRQALNYATDKDAINKTVYFGQGKVANAPIPPGMFQAKDLPGYPFDLDKAKQLMKESSSPNGFNLDMQVRSGNTEYASVATIVKDEWAKIGVNVNIQNLETSVVRENYRSGNYQAQPSGWTNDMNDPSQIVNYEMRSGPGSQFAYWTRYLNLDLNDKITKADLELDPAKRGTMYADIQKTFQDDAPLVWLSYTPATAGWRDYVQGFLIDGLSYYRFETVKLNK
jgi:peptide/nickel transport system substrate-binding protein